MKTIKRAAIDPQIIRDVKQRKANLQEEIENEENEDKRRGIQNEITNLELSIQNPQSIKIPTYERGPFIHPSNR
tara:strand:- start:25 stop:246 length:222 start_codon:yes stop_codon:yes gene_type:complete